MRLIHHIIFSIIALAFVSHANAVVLKISTAYPDGTAIVKTMKRAAKDVEAATEGRVKFKFYPGGVHGDNQTVLKKIKRGLLHGGIFETGALSDDYADSQIYNAPMAFTELDEVYYFRSKIDQEIISGFKERGWTMFGLIDGGFAYAMSKHPISNINDLREQKLWLPANDPYSKKIADGLNMAPIYFGLGEVLTGLQTGVIDTVIAPPGAALALQWYSRVDHMMKLPFIYTVGTLTIANKAYEKISEADQKVVESIFTAAVTQLDKNARMDNNKALAAIENQGLNFITPVGDDLDSMLASGRTATQTLLKQNELSPEIYGKLQRYLAEYRSENNIIP